MERKEKKKKRKEGGKTPPSDPSRTCVPPWITGPLRSFVSAICMDTGNIISRVSNPFIHTFSFVFFFYARLSLLARRGSCSGPLYSHLPVPVREYPAPITWMRRDGSVGTDSTPPMAKLSKTAQLSGWLARGGGFFPQLQVAVILRRNDNNNNNAVAIRQGGFPAFFLITSSVFPGEW